MRHWAPAHGAGLFFSTTDLRPLISLLAAAQKCLVCQLPILLGQASCSSGFDGSVVWRNKLSLLAAPDAQEGRSNGQVTHQTYYTWAVQ